MSSDELLELQPETEPSVTEPCGPAWKILVVDDDDDVHWVTRVVLRNLTVAGRPVALFSARSAAEAKIVLARETDIALVLLDVVMETSDAGLQLVSWIRRDAGLNATRIILRTGQPGQAPELEVIVTYDINDYKAKAELTAQKLTTATIAALRSYDHIKSLEQTNERLLQAKLAAELANRAKAAFLATMTHELKTPLNAILGFAELMVGETHGTLGDPAYRDYVCSIHESGSQLLSIIGDILDIASLEMGAVSLDENPIDLARTVQNCVELVRPKAEAGGVVLTGRVDPELPRLLADRRRLKQILANLLLNAIKFTPVGGSIELAAERDPSGAILLSVADTGIGMAAEEIPIALMAFRQVDERLARRFEGVGLGLPVSKALAELHGGTLSIDSVPGCGTTVRVCFPAARALVGRSPA